MTSSESVATLPHTLTVEQADQVIHAACGRVADIRGRYAAAVQAADGAEMWRCRHQAVEAAGQLAELRAAAAIRRQHAVVQDLEAQVAQAQEAVADARSAVEDAAAANLAAGGRLFDLRREHTVAAAQLGTLARDVTAVQAALQAAEQALKTLIDETARRIG